MTRLKIGSRLALGFGLVVLLLCVLAGVAAWQLRRLNADTAHYAGAVVPSLAAQQQLTLALAQERRKEFRHVLEPDLAQMDRIEGDLAGYDKRIAQLVDGYANALVADDEDRRLLDGVRQALALYQAQWTLVRPLSRQKVDDPVHRDEAIARMIGPSSAAIQAVDAAVQAWWDHHVKLANEQAEAAHAAYTAACAILAGMVAAALAVAGTAAVLTTRSITRPIGRAVQVATAVARGDLGSRIAATGRDEVAQLLQALAHMNERLSGIVAQVRASSDSIATGSAQIAMGNADLAQRTEEQASNLQQTAASMEQLSGTVRSSAQGADHASRLAASASAAAHRGGEAVSVVVGTMQDIAASSRRISEIVGLIDGIAFQTNILALNAAVEAARAGEQGRGFAVVASEVRSLASRSGEAARQIKSLIVASVEKVEAGARQVEAAGGSMAEIVDQVQRVSRLVETMSSAAGEQSTGIGQIGHAVTQLDQVTQRNAALVEESASAADSLKTQAQNLAEVVRVFRLAGDPAY